MRSVNLPILASCQNSDQNIFILQSTVDINMFNWDFPHGWLTQIKSLLFAFTRHAWLRSGHLALGAGIKWLVLHCWCVHDNGSLCSNSRIADGQAGWYTPLGIVRCVLAFILFTIANNVQSKRFLETATHRRPLEMSSKIVRLVESGRVIFQYLTGRNGRN